MMFLIYGIIQDHPPDRFTKPRHGRKTHKITIILLIDYLFKIVFL